MDVYSNQYNKFMTECFGCNSNVSAGLDGGSMMYVTCYTSKSTKDEDALPLLDALSGLYKRIQNEAAINDFHEECQFSPSQAGFSRILAALLNATKGYCVSAPLAKYLINHQSRFQFSHHFVTMPLYPILYQQEEESRSLSIQSMPSSNNKRKLFLSYKANDYRYRPEEAEDYCLYDFIPILQLSRSILKGKES